MAPVHGLRRATCHDRQSLNLYGREGVTRLHSSCYEWPMVIQVLTHFVRQRAPARLFTSVAALSDQEAQPHRDPVNDEFPNVVLQTSSFFRR